MKFKKHLIRFLFILVLAAIKFVPKYYNLTKDNYPGMEKYTKHHASASEMLEQCPVKADDGEALMYVDDVYTYGAGLPIVIGIVQGDDMFYLQKVSVETADHRILEGHIQLINPPKPSRHGGVHSDKTAPEGEIAAIMLMDIDRVQVEPGCIVRADKTKENNNIQRSF